MKASFFALLLSGLFFAAMPTLAAEGKAPIDQTLAREIDLIGDGVPDTISVHLMSKDMNSPFRWTLTITSKGKNIYFVERDDKWLDELFSNKDFVSDCKGYEECKRKYYFEDFPSVVIPKTLYDEVGVRRCGVPQGFWWRAIEDAGLWP